MGKKRTFGIHIVALITLATMLSGCGNNSKQNASSKSEVSSESSRVSSKKQESEAPVKLHVNSLRVTTDDNGIAIIKGNVSGKGKLSLGHINKDVANDGSFSIKYDYHTTYSGAFNEQTVWISYTSDKDKSNLAQETITITPSAAFKAQLKVES